MDSFWCNRQYGPAVEQIKRTIELDPAFANAHYKLGLVYETIGDYPPAIAEYNREESLSGASAASGVALESAYTRGGWKNYCQARLAALEYSSKQRYVSSASFVLAYSRLGDRDHVFRWLQTAFEESAPELVYLNVDSRFDTLRADPRFSNLLSRIGLAPGTSPKP